MPGAPDLKDYRFHEVLSLEPTGDWSYEHREGLIRAAFLRLAERVGGRLSTSFGSVGCLPMDGLTTYFDVLGKHYLAWTYYGHDYGHSLNVELRAKTRNLLRHLCDDVREALTPDFKVERAEEQMPTRATS